MIDLDNNRLKLVLPAKINGLPTRDNHGPHGEFDTVIEDYALYDADLMERLLKAEISFDVQSSSHLRININPEVPQIFICELLLKKRYNTIRIAINPFRIDEHIRALRYYIIPSLQSRKGHLYIETNINLQGVCYLHRSPEKEWVHTDPWATPIRQFINNIRTLKALQNL